MSTEYPFNLPVIKNAAFSVNPTSINSKIVLSVEVVEEVIYLQPEYFYANEIYSGEV